MKYFMLCLLSVAGLLCVGCESPDNDNVVADSFNWDEWRDSVIDAAKNASTNDGQYEHYEEIVAPDSPHGWVTTCPLKGLKVYYINKKKYRIGFIYVYPYNWAARSPEFKMTDCQVPVICFAHSKTSKILARSFYIDDDYVQNLVKLLGAELHSREYVPLDDSNLRKMLYSKEAEGIKPKVAETEE